MTEQPTHVGASASLGIAVELRATPDGARIGLEPVRAADLRDSAFELWWRACARRGAPGVDALELDVSLVPLPRQAGGASSHLDGVRLQVASAEGERFAMTCGRESLQHVAERGARRLLESGALRPDDPYYYDALLSSEGTDPRALALRPSGCGAVLSRRRALAMVSMPLSGLLGRSTAVVPRREDDHELFYTESALRAAEAIARSGERQDPPVETGGVLLGWLGSCPVDGEAFVVVTDAVAAEGADQGAFRLSFSSATWQRLQAAVVARRQHSYGEALRIVGQTHGHPFSAGKPCDGCSGSDSCPRHSAFLSADDRCWSRAVFCNQPWQVGHLFGRDALGRPVARVFGQRGGLLAARGYRVIGAADLDFLRARP